MPYRAVTLHYGEFPGICQLCFDDRYKFGTLVDPQGHSWLICAECINRLWQDRQALHQEERTQQEVDKIKEKVIRQLIEPLFPEGET